MVSTESKKIKAKKTNFVHGLNQNKRNVCGFQKLLQGT